MRKRVAGGGPFVASVVALLLVVGFAGFAIGQTHYVESVPVAAGVPGGANAVIPGRQTVSFSSSMIPGLARTIPNLQFGFVYQSTTNSRRSRWTVDYLHPVDLWADDAFFVEFHGESENIKPTAWVPYLQNSWQQHAPGLRNRVDVSVGAGYRRIIGDQLLLGANAFYDGSRLFGIWHSSGGLGLEMAANGPSNSAIDLTINYYGQVYGDYSSRGSIFPTFNLFDALRTGQGNFDIEAGYSQPVLDESFDLRLKLTGYQYSFGPWQKYGLKTGGELTTRDGVFRLMGEAGHDGVLGTFATVGGYVSIGFQVEDLLRGNNPFSMPEPVFKSPRNLRRLLATPVHRTWHKPSAVVATAKCSGMPDDSAFSTRENHACFWAGRYPVSRDACLSAGHDVLQSTPGGRWLEPYIGAFPVIDYPRDLEPMWICGSAAYARMARGETYAYLIYPRPNAIFWTTELPNLRSNPDVTHVWVYFWDDNTGTWTGPTDYK